jgi:hypothetical protein
LTNFGIMVPESSYSTSQIRLPRQLNVTVITTLILNPHHRRKLLVGFKEKGRDGYINLLQFPLKSIPSYPYPSHPFPLLLDLPKKRNGKQKGGKKQFLLVESISNNQFIID